jgi:hypothetical protein
LKVAAIPAPAPAATKGDALSRRHADNLSQGRAERRADLDDRSFAADRGAAADRDRRGERFHHGDNRPNHSAVVVDRIHDFGDAVPAGLGREFCDEKGNGNRPDYRHQDHESSPWARRGKEIGVVPHGELPEEQQIVDEPDQITEQDRA